MLHIDWSVLIGVLSVLALAVLDWLMGIGVAISKGTFDFHVLPQQLGTTVLPLVGTLFGLAVLQVMVDQQTTDAAITLPLGGTFFAAAAAASVKLLNDIILKAMSLGGTPPPAPSGVGPARTGP